MSSVKDFNNGSLNPKRLFDTLKYKLFFARDNPDFFTLAEYGCIAVRKGTEKHLVLLML